MIYLETVRPMVDAAFNRAKITCFAYGQTGSGKTYTMMGTNNGKEISNPGLYLLCAIDIFSYLEQERYEHLEIWVSFYEIYCGKLYDLLNERNVLTAREDGKQVRKKRFKYSLNHIFTFLIFIINLNSCFKLY